MTPTLFGALVAAAVTVGAIHTLAPDHWVPFAALARARRWPARNTVFVTLLCGFGHVTVSALFGFVGLFFGIQMIRALGERMESVAGLLLVGFGLLYGIWGLRRAAGAKLHGHVHSRYDHMHNPARASVGALFLLFSADPCVAVIPLLFSAAPLGLARTLTVVLLYEAATLATMVALVLPASAGARAFRFRWLDFYGDAAAGAVIATVGITVFALGW
jgi:hypothetical protein